MERITINNYTDLLDFIKHEEVTTKQAVEVICKALKVYSIFEKTKEELIKETENYINKYCINNIKAERPIFLGNLNFDFD